MKKNNLITGILYVLFGVACLIVALLIETKLEGILWGFAGAGIFPGIMMICKYFYWSSPKNKEQYEERLENDRIEQHDELKTKIRDRAGRYAYGIGLVVICFSILAFSILGALEVIDNARMIILYDLYSAVLLLHAHPHRSWCQHGTRSYMLSLFLPVYLKIADLAVCLGLDATFHHKRCRRPCKRRRSGMALLYHVRGDMSRQF